MRARLLGGWTLRTDVLKACLAIKSNGERKDVRSDETLMTQLWPRVEAIHVKGQLQGKAHNTVRDTYLHSILSSRCHSVVIFIQNAVLMMVMLLCNWCRETRGIFV